MQIERKPAESNLEYHKRIVYGKLVDKTLSDIDYTELAELIYGQPYSSDVARRMMYGSRKTLELIESEQINKLEDSNILSELDEKMIELRKERQKFYDQRNAFNKLLRDRSRQEELNEIIDSCIRDGALPAISNNNIHKQDVEVSGKDIIVSLNDIHYGADIHNAWCTYNSDICAEMFSKYLDDILDIANTHNAENCVVVGAGDFISGNIHYSIAVTNKENVIQQIMGVSELIAQFISKLSQHFKTVKFISVPGNHSRINPNKKETLTDERLDDLIEWYVKARLQDFDNVIIDDTHKKDATMSLFKLRGKTYCVVHGDYDDTPSKIQSLQTFAQEPVYAVLSGHMHHNKVDSVQGIHTYMAGSFLGLDDYCVQKRIYGRPEQMVCVCDCNGVICHYDISLR